MLYIAIFEWNEKTVVLFYGSKLECPFDYSNDSQNSIQVEVLPIIPSQKKSE